MVRLFLIVQGVGAIILGHFAQAAIGTAGGTLTLAWWWVGLLFAGGLLALGMALVGHRQTPWALGGAAISTAMIGRAADILANIDAFEGRPSLAVAIWGVMGLSTLTAWVVVGALAGVRE